MNKISIFGGNGFIGSKFCKNDYISKTNNILYLISTVDNYNVHNNLHVDIDTNLKVLMNVLENIPKNSDTIFNFISSWFVYGQNNEIPFREDYSKCNPTGFYSITKYCAEQLLISFCQTYNIKYRIFRLANVLGEGDTKISKKKNALQYLIKQITENKDVELYYGGQVLRDYIYVDDVCNAIKHCMDNAPYNEIINIGSGEPFVFINLINKAIEYSKSKSKIIHIQPTNFHNIVQVRHSYLDIKKLSSYGYKNQFSIDNTIHKLVDFYKNNI
jgi:nucleoside-diphosphate-sugar epimerase